jgi:hypothetical protein
MEKNILLFMLMIGPFMLNAQTLDKHRWQDRVILLYAAGAKDPTLKRQLSLLTTQKAEVTDRDLVIYQLFPSGGISPNGKKLTASQSLAFFQRYDVRPDTFTLILVGKDGGEKKRTGELVPLEDLFGLIDRMPMRRAEMRRKGKDGDQK